MGFVPAELIDPIGPSQGRVRHSGEHDGCRVTFHQVVGEKPGTNTVHTSSRDPFRRLTATIYDLGSETQPDVHGHVA